MVKMAHSNLSDRMYKEYIMELYKNPSNYGQLKNATHEHTEQNTFCGDEIKMQLLVKSKKVDKPCNVHNRVVSI